MPRPSTRATLAPSSVPAPVPAPAPGPASAPAVTPAPRPETGSPTLIPTNTPMAALACMIRVESGTPPVCDPGRVFTADGRGCAEGDLMELAHRFASMVTLLEPAPGSQNWLQVLRDAETAEYSHRGAASSAFRLRAAKGIIVDHIVALGLHHGVLLTSTNVLVQEEGDRAATGIVDIAQGIPTIALAVSDKGAPSSATTPATTAGTPPTRHRSGSPKIRWTRCTISCAQPSQRRSCSFTR